MRLDTPPQSPEELAEKITEYKKSFADDISEFLWNHVLGELARSGCNLEDKADELFPSILLVLESIRSLHLHSNDIHHPLQDFASESFNGEDDDEDNDEDNDEEIDIDCENDIDNT